MRLAFTLDCPSDHLCAWIEEWVSADRRRHYPDHQHGFLSRNVVSYRCEGGWQMVLAERHFSYVGEDAARRREVMAEAWSRHTNAALERDLAARRRRPPPTSDSLGRWKRPKGLQVKRGAVLLMTLLPMGERCRVDLYIPDDRAPLSQRLMEAMATEWPESRTALDPYLASEAVSDGTETKNPQRGSTGETPRSDTSASGTIERDPRVPTYRRDRHRWEITWRYVRPLVEKGETYSTIVEWLHKTHEQLQCGPDTLARIVNAGREGLLNPREGKKS